MNSYDLLKLIEFKKSTLKPSKLTVVILLKMGLLVTMYASDCFHTLTIEYYMYISTHIPTMPLSLSLPPLFPTSPTDWSVKIELTVPKVTKTNKIWPVIVQIKQKWHNVNTVYFHL